MDKSYLKKISAKIAMNCGNRGLDIWSGAASARPMTSPWSATVVAKARAVKHGQAKLESKPQEVHSAKKVMLQVERSMVVVSEKELRRMTKLPRIGKTMLKGVPSLMMGAEDGGEPERLFAFTDEAAPVRRAKLVVQMETGLTSMLMPQQSVISADQGPPWFKHIAEEQNTESGVKELLDREVTGHGYLQSLDEFLLKLTGKENEQEAEPASKVENPVAEAGLTLVGVAAAAAKDSPRGSSRMGGSSVCGEPEVTPVAKGRRSAEAASLLRTPSSKSLVEAEEGATVVDVKCEASESGLGVSDNDGDDAAGFRDCKG